MDEYLIEPRDQFYRRAQLIRVIDGDTIKMDLDLGWQSHLIDNIRLARVNTPEANRYPELPAGRWVTRQVVALIGDTKNLSIWSVKFQSDKYDRCVAEVWVNGTNLSQWLLDHRYAWPTDKHGTIVGLRSIELLTGIPEPVKQLVREAELP